MQKDFGYFDVTPIQGVTYSENQKAEIKIRLMNAEVTIEHISEPGDGLKLGRVIFYVHRVHCMGTYLMCSRLTGFHTGSLQNCRVRIGSNFEEKTVKSLATTYESR